MIRFAKVFEPSSCAAALPGPNTGMPRSRSASATPATSGASGPITTRSIAFVVRELGDGGGVVRVEVDDRRVRGDAGVAGGGEDLVRGLLRAQREDDGVLARARAEDEDLHPASLPRAGHRAPASASGVPWSTCPAGSRPTKGRAALAAVRAAASGIARRAAAPPPRPRDRRALPAAAARREGARALASRCACRRSARCRCVEGPRHTRGTPPNVVETDADDLDRARDRRRAVDGCRGRRPHPRLRHPRRPLATCCPCAPEPRTRRTRRPVRQWRHGRHGADPRIRGCRGIRSRGDRTSKTGSSGRPCDARRSSRCSSSPVRRSACSSAMILTFAFNGTERREPEHRAGLLARRQVFGFLALDLHPRRPRRSAASSRSSSTGGAARAPREVTVDRETVQTLPSD